MTTTQAELVLKHHELYDRAGAVGLVLKAVRGRFEFNIKQADGLIVMDTLEQVELFLRGYELGYKAGL